MQKNQCDEEGGCLTSGGINGMDSIEIRGATVISTSWGSRPAICWIDFICYLLLSLMLICVLEWKLSFFSIITSSLFLNQLTKCLIFNGKEKSLFHQGRGLNAAAQWTTCITWQAKCSRGKILRLKAVKDKWPLSVNKADIMALNLHLKKEVDTFASTQEDIYICISYTYPHVFSLTKSSAQGYNLKNKN